MSNTDLWATDEWRQEILAWAGAELTQVGRKITGDAEQFHILPWSTVLRLPSTNGVVYLKAGLEGYGNEAAITRFIAQRRPDIVPQILGADEERHWLLLDDAGQKLADITRADPPDLSPWPDLLRRYAELQIQLIADAAHLLELGAFDHRTPCIPTLFAEMLNDDAGILVDGNESLTPDELAALRVLQEPVSELSAELAAIGIPETLQHDDFHDGNVFLMDGVARFGDWAECAVAHPFFTVALTMRGAAYFSKVTQEHPSIVAMREAYLDVWRLHYPADAVQRAFDITQRLEPITRAHTYYVLLSLLEGEDRLSESDSVPFILRRLLQHFGVIINADEQERE